MSKPKPLPLSPVDGRTARDNAVRVAQARRGDLHNLCLKFVRQCWEIPPVYLSAREAWENTPAEHRHAIGTLNSIPVGAPVFTRSRRGDKYGHVLITGGWWRDRKGKTHRIFWSTDIKGYGEVHGVALDTVLRKWDHEVLGWTSSLNGYKLDL